MNLKKRNLIIANIEDIKKKFLKEGFFYILDFSSNPLKYQKYEKNKKFLLIKLSPKSKRIISSITNIQNIIKIYNFYLPKLSRQLNKIHKKKYSISYWELVVGNWLMEFISIVNYQYNILNYAKKKYHITSILLPENSITNLKNISSENTLDFIIKTESVKWNSLLYYQIVKNFYNIKIVKCNSVRNKKLFLERKSEFIIKTLLKKILLYFRLSIKDKVYIYDRFISKKFIFFLKLKFLCFPIINNIPFINFNIKENNLIRNFKLSFKKNKLNRILDYLIPLHIPRVFLENYETVNQFLSKINLPEKPSVIFSSHSFFDDDMFKIWAAKKKEKNNSKIITMQHGSGYFFMKDFGHEYYQKKISDRIISWGGQKSKKIISGFNYKTVFNKNIRYNNYGNLIFINYELNKYRYCAYYGNQVNASIRHNFYYNSVNLFFKNISQKIVNSSIIKSEKYSDHKDKIFFEKLKINYDQNQKLITNYFKQSRVVVIGKIVSTVFLEALNYNIPTIVFFDKNAELLNFKARASVERLKKVKIIFDNPLQAAIHINKIWADVGSWWFSPQVQKEVNYFCNSFSKKTTNPINDMYQILKNEIN